LREWLRSVVMGDLGECGLDRRRQGDKMAGLKVLKRDNLKDNDWVLLHRETGGYGSPRLDDNPAKQFAMTVRDFHSDILTSPVTDTDAENAGVENLLMRPVGFRALQPVVADVDRIVVSTDMIVGAYTIANATPAGGIALNVTVTNTTVDGFDTPGTINVVGTDIDDQVLVEPIIPATNSTVQGTAAFKTVTSVTGVGWVIDSVNDEDAIEVGFGELIGLPDYLLHDTVIAALFNNVREGTHPTVTSSTAVLAENTVDLNSALNGSVVVIYYLAGKWI